MNEEIIDMDADELENLQKRYLKLSEHSISLLKKRSESQNNMIENALKEFETCISRNTPGIDCRPVKVIEHNSAMSQQRPEMEAKLDEQILEMKILIDQNGSSKACEVDKIMEMNKFILEKNIKY